MGREKDVSFSREWDELYKTEAHLSMWPWSDLVSYVHRYAKPTSGFRRVLELGCGAGANIPLFLQLEADYHAVEGSPAIVERLHGRYPALKESIVVGDFTRELPFSGDFDLVVDRGSLTCNSTEAILSALRQVHARLRSGGKLLGIDWFSTSHPDAAAGTFVDAHTRKDIPEGHLAGTGVVHFSDGDHLRNLLGEAGFEVERLEHKLHELFVPRSGSSLATWNFVGSKP